MKKLRIFIMVLTLMLAVPTVSTYTDSNIATVEAKTKKKSKKKKSKTVTVTIKKNSDIAGAVTKVHSTALKHKPMILKIKGNKKKSVKLLEKFEKQLQQYNTYSVIINVDRGKTSKGYTPYEISKEDTLTYDYACQYIQKCIDYRKKSYDEQLAAPDFKSQYASGGGGLIHNLNNTKYSKLFSSTEPYAYLSSLTNEYTEIVLPPEGYTGTWIDYHNEKCLPEYRVDETTPTQTFAEYTDLKPDWKEYCPEILMFEDGYTFAQLSTLQQQSILPGVGYNGTKTTRDLAAGSTSHKLKNMVEGKTIAMCYECALYQIAIEEQLDIPTKYVSSISRNHAWMFVQVEFKGDKFWLKWDDGHFGIDLHSYVRKGSKTLKNSIAEGVPTSISNKHTYLH